MQRSVRLTHGVVTGLLALALVACAPTTIPFPAGTDIPADTPYRVEADPAKGFHSAYFLLIPAGTKLRNGRIPLLLHTNNSGKTDDRDSFHEDLAIKWLKDYSGVADALHSVLLVPGFPRPRAQRLIYTHALDRDTLTTDIPRLSRVDLQLLAMIADARDRLSGAGIQTREKVVMTGFSAAGTFASRFTVLHPEHVLVAVVGSPGGWPIVPVENYRNTALPYPVGISDLQSLTGKPFDRDAFCSVPKLFFIGGEDTNDSVTYPDSFDPNHAEIVNALFGTTPVDRWDDAEAIYRAQDCRATFKLYPGTGHEMSPDMQADALTFLMDTLEGAESSGAPGP